MKILTTAIALAFALPAAAQTTPAGQHENHAQHQQHDATGARHQDHQQGGQRDQHQRHDIRSGCCADRNGNGRMDCCEAMGAAGARGCCQPRGGQDGQQQQPAQPQGQRVH